MAKAIAMKMRERTTREKRLLDKSNSLIKETMIEAVIGYIGEHRNNKHCLTIAKMLNEVCDNSG